MLALCERTERGCIVRPGKSGYWLIRVSYRKQPIGAHRHMLSTKLGRQLGPDEWALHTCDTPACINPDHLVVGTPADNHRDTVQRQRRVARPYQPSPTPVESGSLFDGFVTAQEARDKLGVPYQTLINWIYTSKISATRKAGRWYLPIDAVEKRRQELLQ